jgi:hypothetical protein
LSSGLMLPEFVPSAVGSQRAELGHFLCSFKTPPCSGDFKPSLQNRAMGASDFS